jgi:hypothetical protein
MNAQFSLLVNRRRVFTCADIMLHVRSLCIVYNAHKHKYITHTQGYSMSSAAKRQRVCSREIAAAQVEINPSEKGRFLRKRERDKIRREMSPRRAMKIVARPTTIADLQVPLK